jgi:predicted Zn-dependent peptidase
MAIRVSQLESGMRVVTDTMPGLKSAALGVWVDVGARHETAATMGISHLLEHMAFKGTKTRTAKEIAEQIEAVGGYLNAYTGREQTAYFARVLKDDVALAVDILADILLNSTFDAEELAREKGVVIQEIGQAEDTPDDIIFDHLQSVAYPDQPIGRPILGRRSRARGDGRPHWREVLGHRRRAQRRSPASRALRGRRLSQER